MSEAFQLPLVGTYVFHFANADDAKAVNREIMDRWPLMAEGDVTRLTGVAIADMLSAADAARIALDCRDLDEGERIELAQEVLDCMTWADCQTVFAKWEMRAENGELVDARAS